MIRKALLLASLLGSVVPASAAVRCVNPAGTGACLTTIQAAVDAAAPNDTINIAPGTYYENVRVQPDKAGLKLVGASRLRTILDASSNSAIPVTLATLAIDVFAPNVTIRNMTIRNGGTDAIQVEAAGATIQGVTFLGIGCAGVNLFAVLGTQILGNEFRSMGCSAVRTTAPSAGTVVKLNTLYGSGDVGFSVVGDQAVVSSNKAYRCGNDCISITGATPVAQFNSILGSDGLGIEVNGIGALVTNNRVTDSFDEAIGVQGANAVVKQNVITNVHDDGMDIGGDGATVSNNVLTNTHFGGIFVNGATAIVSNNRVTHADGEGIGVFGATPIVTANVVAGTRDGMSIQGTNPKAELNRIANVVFDGLDVDCAPDCTVGTVARNSVADTYDEGRGIVLRSNAAGLIVSNNVVTRSAGVSYQIDGTRIALDHNIAIDQGSGLGSCYEVAGNGEHTLTFNTATRCSENGFKVISSNNTLTSNVATSSYGNGFEISTAADAGFNALRFNTAIGSAGAGFAILATTDTVLTSNAALVGNRTGFCDDGIRTGLDDNKFASTAPVCDIQR